MRHAWSKGLRWPEWERSIAGASRLPTGEGRPTVLAGTVFHRTRSPLRLWFLAAWELTSQKYGANASGSSACSDWEATRQRGSGSTLAMVRPDRELSGVYALYVRGGWSAGARRSRRPSSRSPPRRTQDRENTGVGCPTSPLRFCEASSRIASHRQAAYRRMAKLSGTRWAFHEPSSVPRTHVHSGGDWVLGTGIARAIWRSPFASTDAHPGLAACCSTACLSLFSVLPRQPRHRTWETARAIREYPLYAFPERDYALDAHPHRYSCQPGVQYQHPQ